MKLREEPGETLRLPPARDLARTNWCVGVATATRRALAGHRPDGRSPAQAHKSAKLRLRPNRMCDNRTPA